VNRRGGFTLVELIVTIAILGIIAAVVVFVIQKPLEGQLRAQRRSELSDIADTALRRAGRDVRLAVPNSLRLAASGSNDYLELLLSRTGGRYRSQLDDGTVTGEDFLDFTANDTIFDTLGRLSTLSGQVVTVGDLIVIHNLGISGANAYAGDNTSAVTAFAPGGGAAANEDRITINSKLFPLESPGRRFQVVSTPVTFECIPGALDANGNGTGQFRRVSGYTIAATQPTGTYGGTPVIAPLANNVTSCDIQYTVLPLQARGLVAFSIGLSRGGEAVTLYYEVHVSNVP
jgi:MSHA biogenesis protein MshO